MDVESLHQSSRYSAVPDLPNRSTINLAGCESASILSITHQHQSMDDSLRVPCALLWYQFCHIAEGGSETHGRLSQEECEKAFQFWVAHIRPQCASIPPEEQLMCPMLYCRHSSDNEKSALEHFAQCPRISDTVYWCAPCSRPESFINCGAKCKRIRAYSSYSKESILDKAANFFRHLGCMSVNKSKCPWATHSKICEVVENLQNSSRPPELDKTNKIAASEMPNDFDFSQMPDDSTSELSGRISHHLQHGKTTVEDDLPSYEVASHLSRTIQDEVLTSLSPPIRDSNTDMTAELWGDLPDIDYTAIHDDNLQGKDLEQSDPMIEAGVWKNLPSTPTSDFWQSGDTCGGVSETPSRRMESVVAQIRPDAINYPANERRQLWTEMIANEHHLGKDGSLGDVQSQPWQAPLNDTHSYDRWTSYTEGNEASNFAGTLTTTQLSVQEIYKLAPILKKEWKNKLISVPDLASKYPEMSDRMLLERGINALGQFFWGSLVNDFEDVLALVHVAFILSFVLNADDEMYIWEDFLNDMLDWRHAITDEGHAHLFFQLIHRSWCSETLPDSSIASISPPRSCPKKLFDRLKHGRIITICSHFLDSVSHAIIPARNDQLLVEHLASVARDHEANIERMICQVTQPLEQASGIEAFREVVITTEFQLRGGLLHNPRELEVTLLSNGLQETGFSPVFKRYRQTVRSLCDWIMSREGLDWRDRYHATELEWFLAASLEAIKSASVQNELRLDTTVPESITSEPMAAVSTKPESTVREPMTPVELVNKSPTSTVSTEPQSLMDWSPVPTDVTSPTRFSVVSMSSSNTLSPTNDTESTSPTSEPRSPTTIPPKIRCDCGKLFKGFSCWTNLQRHQRTAKVHNKLAQYRCEFCNAKFTRSDNLNSHLGSHNSSSHSSTMSWVLVDANDDMN